MVQTNMKGGTDLISKIMAKILERNVKLQVPEQFNLSKDFDDWYQRLKNIAFDPKHHYTFLFCDLSFVYHPTNVAINLNKIIG